MGEICPYQDFYGGRPIKRKTKEVEEVEVPEEEEDSSDNSEGAPHYGYSSFCIFFSCFHYSDMIVLLSVNAYVLVS